MRAFAAALIGWCLTTVCLATPGRAAPCGVLGAGPAGGEHAPVASRGIEPSAGAPDAPGISKIPASDGARSGRVAGEALLALPKAADGSLPSDFRLAEGAGLAESYWSPVLCATVARVVGPPDRDYAELVEDLPESALLVPHDRYVTAAEVRSAPGSADPYLSLQYGLEQVGALAARSVTDGRGVGVAVLDSAPATDHPELRRVRVETLEGGPSSEPAVHGTLVTGIIAAAQGNGIGIAGVAPGADLVAIPVCSPTGAGASDTCRLYDVLRGLDRAWAVEAGILNLSIVGPPNPLLGRAVERLEQLGSLVVAAAGSGGGVHYPAAYPAVIGVGAVDSDGSVLEGSGAPASAQMLAPGVEILSTVPGGSFAFGDGTSLAAAHVSGVLALLAAADGDGVRARQELFRTAWRGASLTEAARLPQVCEVLRRLARPCVAAPDAVSQSPSGAAVPSGAEAAAP